MKEVIKPVYICDFCKKKLFVKHAMVRHEFICGHNPKNIALCRNCIFIEEIEKTFKVDDGDFEGYVQISKGYKCRRFDKEMYSLGALKKNLITKYPDQFTGMEQMPVDCEGYQPTMLASEYPE